MIEKRWRSTRARLNREADVPDGTGLWSRIEASRRAGQSANLPAADPRRRMSPVLPGVLAVAVLFAEPPSAPMTCQRPSPRKAAIPKRRP